MILVIQQWKVSFKQHNNLGKSSEELFLQSACFCMSPPLHLSSQQSPDQHFVRQNRLFRTGPHLPSPSPLVFTYLASLLMKPSVVGSGSQLPVNTTLLDLPMSVHDCSSKAPFQGYSCCPSVRTRHNMALLQKQFSYDPLSDYEFSNSLISKQRWAC